VRLPIRDGRFTHHVNGMTCDGQNSVAGTVQSINVYRTFNKNIFDSIYLIILSLLNTTGCVKIREFRIQSVVGKNPVELEKYLEKKIRSS
jgi:hypothetical protein